MSNWQRQRVTPQKLAEFFNVPLPEHIKYDPKVKHQYRIIRTQSYDGTLMFRTEVLAKIMNMLIGGGSYYKPDGEPKEDEYPVYTVGDFKIATVYGLVELPCGRYPGQRESIILPVKVEWFKK